MNKTVTFLIPILVGTPHPANSWERNIKGKKYVGLLIYKSGKMSFSAKFWIFKTGIMRPGDAVKKQRNI